MKKKTDGTPGRPDWRGANPLTFEEAADLAESIISVGNARQVARLLLLVHAFTYIDARERENLSSAIEDRLVSSLPGVDEFRYEAMGRELAALWEGGGE
jgi:hypothetical protein